MSDERKTTTEEWLYAGERITATGKLANAWVDARGDTLIFKKLGGSMPGHAYEVEIVHDGEHTSVVGRPRYLAEKATRQATPVEVETWRAETAAARQTIASQQAEKQAAESDELEEALDVLRRHHARLRSYAKKGAFASYILGEIQRPARKTEDDQ